MVFNFKKKTFNRIPSNLCNKNYILRFGYYGIKSCGFGKLTIEKSFYLHNFLEKHLKLLILFKKVRVWNRVSTNLTLTTLSSESRMGKGKGNIITQFTYIKPGQVLFEVEKINFKDWKKLFSKICGQIGFKIMYIQKIY